MRSIDEIARDLERAKTGKEKVVITGAAATSFGDWFGKKKEPEKVDARRSQSSSQSTSNRPSPLPTTSPAKSSAASLSSRQTLQKDLKPSRNSSSNANVRQATSSAKPATARASASAPGSQARTSLPLKRRHSQSESYSSEEEFSDSPPPPKRSKAVGGSGFQSEIFALFGRDRKKEANIVDSDEDGDDMEVAGADLWEEEERRSVSRCPNRSWRFFDADH
jgi:hypothetical protein